MASATQLPALATQGEQFPTEWSLSSADEPGGSWQMPPSENPRPLNPAPTLSRQDVGRTFEQMR
jgi:hypothetical protein